MYYTNLSDNQVQYDGSHVNALPPQNMENLDPVDGTMMKSAVNPLGGFSYSGYNLNCTYTHRLHSFLLKNAHVCTGTHTHNIYAYCTWVWVTN